MQLLRIHIDNFGKIHDFTMDFQQGFHVIKQPNAWGKSTLAAFIRIMFYGFDTKKVPGLPERERQFYTPWQGGIYGGELDFETGGRTYRISRTFGATEKKDICHVYDLATNLESVDFSGNIGEALFDLDGNSFKRSVFIQQNDCESTTSDAINAKLGNLAANTNDINNYETAQERIKNMMNALTPNRATGSIKKRANRIAALEDELRIYDSTAESLGNVMEERAELEAQKARISEEREHLAGQLRIASEDSGRRQKQLQYLDICEETVKKFEALKEFAGTFPAGIPDEGAFQRAIETARVLEKKQYYKRHQSLTEAETEQLDKLSGMFERAIPTEVEIDSMITEYQSVSGAREDKARLDAALEQREKVSMIVEPLPEKPGSRNAFSVLGIVFGGLGIIAFAAALIAFLKFSYSPLWMFSGVGLLVVATAFFVVAAVVQKKAAERYERRLAVFCQKQQDEINEISELQDKARGQDSKIREMEKSVCDFLETYQVYCGIGSYSGALYELKNQVRDYHRLNDRMKACEKTEFECREYASELNAFAEQWQINLGDSQYPGTLNMLRTEAARYHLAEEEAAAAAERKTLFESENDMDDLKLRVTAEGSLEEINAQIAVYDEQLDICRENLEISGRRLDDLKETLDVLDEQKQELSRLEDEQKEEMHRYRILAQTQEYLKNAREQFTARYMAPISNAFRKYYTQIVPSENDDWVIDANIALKKKEEGELREISHLSAGFQDLMGVCMRLALVDAMFREEKPFLILDDPFVNLDEEKTAKGMELLDFVAKEYQTIYFTCHNSRTPQ